LSGWDQAGVLLTASRISLLKSTVFPGAVLGDSSNASSNAAGPGFPRGKMYSPGLGALHLKGFAQALVHPHSGTHWETPPVARLDKAVCGIE
jgi:hypothetical protein